jgi:hypothetical protein
MATFGYTTEGSNFGGNAREGKMVGLFTLSENGLISSISIYGGIASVGQNIAFKGVIYSSLNGEPDALLGIGEEVIPDDFPHWYTSNFSTNINLNAGDYYIGILNQFIDGSKYIRWMSNNGGTRRSNLDTYSDGASNPFGAADSGTEKYSVYATYTSTGRANASGRTWASGRANATNRGISDNRANVN